MSEQYGVLTIYPGGGSRRLEGPYGWWRARAEAGTLRRMMHGRAPSKGIFIVDYDAEAAAMKDTPAKYPGFSEYPYSAAPAVQGGEPR